MWVLKDVVVMSWNRVRVLKWIVDDCIVDWYVDGCSVGELIWWRSDWCESKRWSDWCELNWIMSWGCEVWGLLWIGLKCCMIECVWIVWSEMGDYWRWVFWLRNWVDSEWSEWIDLNWYWNEVIDKEQNVLWWRMELRVWCE